MSGYAACVAASWVEQLNSVPSIHIRCKMTVSFRSTATLALLKLLRLVTGTPQVLRGDHFATRVKCTLAASYRQLRLATLTKQMIVDDPQDRAAISS